MAVAEGWAPTAVGGGDALRPVRIWLSLVIALVAAMVIVGGATRLTDSGLSITEWKPILGAIPPLSAADWADAFEKYKQIPEYQVQNRGMTLAEFKVIYWWEWAHRFLGRVIGLVFALPLALFVATGRVRGRLAWQLVGLLALGGLQGAVGWWMVASGLVDRLDVAPYRLAVHLTLACVIFAALIAVLVGTTGTSRRSAAAVAGARVVLALVFVQIVLGALVAGTDGGFVYTTWPLMNGAFVPDDIAALSPAWRNLFENPTTAQFAHRLGAYVLFLAAWANVAWTWRVAAGRDGRLALLIAVAVTVQAAIGIVTLVTVTPLALGLLHQAGALVVIAVTTIAAVAPRPPLQTLRA